MLRSVPLLAAIALTSCVTGAHGDRHPATTVAVRFSGGYAICIGLCPDFETQVQSTGLVMSRNRVTKRASRFRVGPSKVKEFVARLDALRPMHDQKADKECAQVTLENGSPDPLSMAKPDDIEIRWIERGTQVRLTACYANAAIRKPLQQALRDLGVDPWSGSHIDASGAWIP
jgi:hypothetical protein